MKKDLPKIYGFNETSEAGVKVLAPSIFIQGCNFQCPFCFNALLAKSEMRSKHEVDISVVEAFIEKESPSMIMISGGEPLMIKSLESLMDHFLDLGLKIGLSTHGGYPDRLEALLPKISYVSMDVKSPDPIVYDKLDLIKNNDTYNKMLESKKLLRLEGLKSNRRDGFEYEVRTTLYPPYIGFKELRELGELIGEGGDLFKNERWILQQYRPTKYMYDMEATKNVEAYDYETLVKMLKVAQEYTTNVHLRYV